MSLTNAAENNLLKLLFNNTTWANVGDATGVVGSTGAGSFHLSLHTADPGETGDQSTSEVSYTGYARVAVNRTTGGFTVTNNSVSPFANVSFPACTGGTATATHFGIGTAATGAGNLILKGSISPTISISNGVTPQLTTSTAVTAD